MLKALVGFNGDHGYGGKAALLGLSHANLARLKSGVPIAFNLSELTNGSALDPSCEVVIFADRDEEAMLAEIEKRFGHGSQPRQQPSPDTVRDTAVRAHRMAVGAYEVASRAPDKLTRASLLREALRGACRAARAFPRGSDAFAAARRDAAMMAVEYAAARRDLLRG